MTIVKQKDKISFKAIPNRVDWIKVNGSHQTFSIEHNLYDDNRFDQLKGNIEDIIQWIIWKKINKPKFDTNKLNCDWFYNKNIEIIQEIKRETNKINSIVDEIIKDMPNNYKKEIKKIMKI